MAPGANNSWALWNELHQALDPEVTSIYCWFWTFNGKNVKYNLCSLKVHVNTLVKSNVTTLFPSLTLQSNSPLDKLMRAPQHTISSGLCQELVALVTLL